MAEQQNIRPPTVSTTILVVDDEPAVTKLCKTILQQAGFTVLDADGSSEALKICTQHEGPIDLLLTDLILPPLGFQLASSSNQFPHVHGHELAIRAATIRKGLRVILMSGNPDKELAGHGIKRRTLPFLAKPFEKDGLISLVREALAKPAPAFDLSGQGKAANDVDWFG
ncbi:MAG: response regulator [Nitrospirae bacterium]|nr:response regulator [Nitrospirota bacterium]